MQENRTLLDEIGIWSRKNIYDLYKFRKSSEENLPDQKEREKRKYQEYKSSMNFRLMKLKIKDSNNIKPSCRQYYLKIVCPKGELPVGIEKETSKILALGSPKWNETLSFLVKKENWDNRRELKLECILLSMDYAMAVQQESKVETTANELLTKRSIDFVHKWSFVLFDIDGSTAKVESINLSSTANAVSLTKDKLTFAVEVLEVAGNEKELDTFKEEWEKGPRAIAIRTEISRRQDINEQKYGFLDVWPHVEPQWSLVLLDTDGTTSKVELTKRALPQKKGDRLQLQINGRPFNVEVLEVSDTERELDIFRDRWKKTNRATAIARETVNQRRDGFLNVDPVVPTWSLVLYDIDGSRKHVESAQLPAPPEKNVTVTLTTGDKTYEVEVLEVADTEEELAIFNKKWINSPRAKAIFKRKEKFGSLSVRPVKMKKLSHGNVLGKLKRRSNCARKQFQSFAATGL